jgi:hypothetical protein
MRRKGVASVSDFFISSFGNFDDTPETPLNMMDSVIIALRIQRPGP